MPTVPLHRYLPPLALEVRPVARLEGGFVVPEAAGWFPPTGPCRLVVWTPGPEEPAFCLLEGALEREGARWRFLGPLARGWVVLHEAARREGPCRKA